MPRSNGSDCDYASSLVCSRFLFAKFVDGCTRKSHSGDRPRPQNTDDQSVFTCIQSNTTIFANCSRSSVPPALVPVPPLYQYGGRILLFRRTWRPPPPTRVVERRLLSSSPTPKTPRRCWRLASCIARSSRRRRSRRHIVLRPPPRQTAPLSPPGVALETWSSEKALSTCWGCFRFKTARIRREG